MKKFICTYFDYNFLPRGLALYDSIKSFYEDFSLFVLTFDNKAYDSLCNIGDNRIIPISIEEYNSYFNTNIDKFDDRKQYYFSATPNICLYVLNKYPSIDILLYLDADTFLFHSLDSLYEEFGDASIGICPHRLNPISKRLIKNHGVFNVGVNLFRNSDEGRKCLLDWKHDCDSWYKGKDDYPLYYFSDQIFLDSWPKKYSDVVVIKNIGVDLAPWNASNYSFKEKNGIYYVNDVPVVIYHFSSLINTTDNKWNANSIIYLTSIKKTLMKLYENYITKIEAYSVGKRSFATVNITGSIKKKLFYWLMSFFMNEDIIMSRKK